MTEPVYDCLKTVLAELTKLEANERLKQIEKIRQMLHEVSPNKEQPVDRIQWVPLEKVTPNEYNPNAVAKVEMGLLYTSILHDGYTQPVVTVYDSEKDIYEIVDGFHRYYTCKSNKDIRDRNHGLLPIVVIDKKINDRMASTVRHNRARGKHSVDGMASMVFSMLDEGWTEAQICRELGMEPEEVLRLKHITGFSKLFENSKYRRAWETKSMIRIREQHAESAKEAV